MTERKLFYKLYTNGEVGRRQFIRCTYKSKEDVEGAIQRHPAFRELGACDLALIDSDEDEEAWESVKSLPEREVTVAFTSRPDAPLPENSQFSCYSRLSDATAIREMTQRNRLQIIASSFSNNLDFQSFLRKKRRHRQSFQYNVLACLSETDASKIQYYESFAGLLKHTHGMFIGVANGSNLVAAIDKLLGTNEPFKADINWAGAIQQVEVGANDGWRLAKGLIEEKVCPIEATRETAAKLKLVTQSEAIASKRIRMNRAWQDPMPALITDGRLVYGATIYPAYNGHSMDITGACALANSSGDVDPFSVGFDEVLYFVWTTERMSIRAAAESLYEDLYQNPPRLSTQTTKGLIFLGKRRGIQTFECTYHGVNKIIRLGLSPELRRRANEAELKALCQVDNELRFLENAPKIPGIDYAVGSISEPPLCCVLWNIAGQPMPSILSVNLIGMLLRDITSILLSLQVQGWSHADVSIENILMTDNSEGKKTFKLIDYGMATKIGEAFSCHSTRLLTCASSQLQSEYAAAEDDVESLMYVLLSLAGLVLPWANIATSGNKAAVHSARRPFLLSPPQIPELSEELQSFVNETCACLRGEKDVLNLLKAYSAMDVNIATPLKPSAGIS